MPKKTRKMKQRAALRRGYPETQPIEMEDADNVPAAVSPVRPILPAATRNVMHPTTYDYSHIYNDLRRIALFAAFFFGVLIVLSFVIK